MGLTICLFSACHNELWDAIDGLDSRITKLEELCKEMNTNISALQTIVDVLQSNDFITSIVEIKKDGEIVGYTITFDKHDPITIYHGQDGKDGQNGADGKDGANGQDGSTPVIGVAQDTDGVYYWTLNGEWLLDDNGNKLPVSGKDGQDGANGSNGQDGADGKDGQDGEDGKDGADGQKGQDGITPQLKIEDSYWYISYDNGATWTQLGKATGEDGQDGKDGADGKDGKDGQNGADGKDGQDGDSMFQSVTQDEKYVYFTLSDGTIITVAKYADKKKVDLVMFMGQSNMAGRGSASESVIVTEGHGYEFRAISDPTKLYPVVEPFGVNENNPTSGVSEKSKTGSLVSAFIEGHYKYRQVPIVGVSCSVGGTATSFWAPNKNPLNDAIARHDSAKVWLEKNGYTIEHDYIVWLQGEADGKNGVNSEQYASNLTAIIEEMIAKTGIEFCAIIRVGHCKTDLTRNRDIIYSQTNLCKTYDKAVMISTMLAGCLGDQMKDASHYTQSTYNTVGLDAGKHAAYYINTGTQPAMYDPEYDNYFPYSEIKRKWLITTQLDYGAIYTGPQQVIDNEAYVATITLMAGYAFDTYSISMGNTKITPVIDNGKMTISIANVTEDIEIVVKTTNENSGEANDTLFNFDFTKHTLDDYVLDGTFTVPSNSNLSTIMYDNLLGANFNGNLPNGLIITNPIDASKAWTLEFVASFAQPSDLAGNRRAFLSGDNLTPFIFINGGTVSTLSFQISVGSHLYLGAGKLIYDAETSYKITYNGNGKCSLYINNEHIQDASINFTGNFTRLLGNVEGKSTAYIWKDVEENKKSYLKTLKIYYN